MCINAQGETIAARQPTYIGDYRDKSMTGFGRGEQVNDDRKIVVEIKAVNHRFCDMNVKLPKKLNYFETDIRTCLKEYIQRGK